MHTLQLEIDDSIFDKFMGFLDILPKEKIVILEEIDNHSISMDTAKQKVENALHKLSNEDGIPITSAFEKILLTK